MVKYAPMGDPMELRIHSYELTLRLADAEKIEIENIRGVNSDRAVSKLVELGLVKEVGRLDAPGRPMLFGTTEDFLRSFGVQSIDELPTISEDMVEQYKEEAELEIAGESFDTDNSEDSDGQITLGI